MQKKMLPRAFFFTLAFALALAGRLPGETKLTVN